MCRGSLPYKVITALLDYSTSHTTTLGQAWLTCQEPQMHVQGQANSLMPECLCQSIVRRGGYLGASYFLLKSGSTLAAVRPAATSARMRLRLYRSTSFLLCSTAAFRAFVSLQPSKGTSFNVTSWTSRPPSALAPCHSSASLDKADQHP